MKGSYLILCSLAAVLCACTATDVPTVRESDAAIEQLSPKLTLMESVIDTYDRPPAPERNVSLRVRAEALNKLLRAISGNRSDDVRIKFLRTPRLLEEKKKALGIPYTNYVGIDSGAMTVNLRTLELRNSRKNNLTMSVDMSGIGNVDISGKYTAITASASPIIRASLKDSIMFTLKREPGSGFILEPVPGFVQLETTIAIELLGWEIPYSKSIPVRTVDLIPAIQLPIGVASRLRLPAPNEARGEKFVFEDVPLRTDRIATSLENGWIGVAFDVSLIK